jgi:hypothetical protein
MVEPVASRYFSRTGASTYWSRRRYAWRNERKATADNARQVCPDLKVLFVPRYAETAVVRNDRLALGVHLMIKPFATEDLASRIKELMTGDRMTVLLR